MAKTAKVVVQVIRLACPNCGEFIGHPSATDICDIRRVAVEATGWDTERSWICPRCRQLYKNPANPFK